MKMLTYFQISKTSHEKSKLKDRPFIYKHMFIFLCRVIHKTLSVNHASFEDVKKNLLDNNCNHQKGRECELCSFLIMSKRIHLIMIVIIKKGENVNV